MGKERVLDLPFPFERVWDAATLVLRQSRWNVTRVDKDSGNLEVRLVMDLLTREETFYIGLTRIDEKSTRVRLAGRTDYQFLDWGISGQNMDSFLSGLQRALKS